MQHGSLFAGIGGFDLGFDQAGMHTRWQVEIDRQCQQLLSKQWPTIERYSDVKEITKGFDLAAVDVISGGFPCQDVSVAGARAGLAGKRSGLWFDFARILDDHRPEWVVIENVPGLLSSNGGADFATILRRLANLGYGVGWRILDSQFFGVPQRRRRVFIVGHLGDYRTIQVLFESEGMPGDSPEGGQAGEEIAGTIGTNSADGFRTTDLDQQGAYIAGMVPGNSADSYGIGVEEETSPPARGGGAGVIPTIAFDVAGPLGGGNDRIGRRTEDDPNLVVGPYWDDGEVVDALDRSQIAKPQMMPDRRRFPAVFDQLPESINENQRAEVRLGQQTDSLKGTGGKPGQGYQAAVTDVGVRRLMPIECERLQGFPDGWTDGFSDTARYRMLGNAVTVPVAEWLGRRILAAAS